MLFWSLDRFSRECALATLNYLRELESYSVGFRSFTERYLDSTGVFKDAIIAILATLAKQESMRITERVKAGMERARAEHKHVGRPAIDRKLRDRIKKLAARKMSKAAIARKLRVSRATVQNYLAKRTLRRELTAPELARRRLVDAASSAFSDSFKGESEL